MTQRTYPRLSLLLLLVVPLALLVVLRLIEGNRAPSEPGPGREVLAARTIAAPTSVDAVEGLAGGPQSGERDAATRAAVPLPEGAPVAPTDRPGLLVVPAATPADESISLVAGFPWTYEPTRVVELAADGTFLLRDVPEGPITFALTARYLRLRGDQASEEDGVLVVRPELHARIKGNVQVGWELAPGELPEVWVGRLPASLVEWTSWSGRRSGRKPIWIAQVESTDGSFEFDAVLPDTPLVVAAMAPGGLLERRLLTLLPGEVRHVLLVPAQAASLSGRLVGGPDLDPSDYRLQVERANAPGADASWGTWHTARFDALDGSFRVQGVQPGRLRLVARGPSYGELEFDAPPGPTAGLELVVGAPASFTGTVVWDDGAPVDEETLYVQVFARHPRSGSPSVSLLGGVFRADGVTGGLRYHLSAWCQGGEGELIATSEPVEYVAPATDLTLSLPRPAEIAGRVRMPDGAPAPTAVVNAGGRKVATDAAGEFRSAVPAGTLALFATAPGTFPGSPVWLDLAPGEVREGLVLELAGAAAALRGVVVDASGAPVTRTGLLVTTDVVGARQVATNSVWTNANGEFRLTDQKPGRVAVSCVLSRTPVLPGAFEVGVDEQGLLQLPPRRYSAGPVEVELRSGEEAFVELLLTTGP